MAGTGYIVASSTGTYSTGGVGRKTVQLSNGWLVALEINGTTDLRLQVSTDKGHTWAALTTITNGFHGAAIASRGTMVYVLGVYAADIKNYLYKFDATTVGTTVSSILSNPNSSTSPANSFSPGCGLWVDSTGTLHAVWACKTQTNPNSTNIRYAKSIDDGVTWGRATGGSSVLDDITTANTTGLDYTNPSVIAVASNGTPLIVAQSSSSTAHAILCFRFTGSAWQAGISIYDGGASYVQENPTLAIAQDGSLGVAWDGKDATDSAVNNIRNAFSTDNGVTWSAPLKLTAGNLYDQIKPSNVFGSDGLYYVVFQGIDSAINTTYYQIRYASLSGGVAGTWNALVTVTNSTAGNVLDPAVIASRSVLWLYRVGSSVFVWVISTASAISVQRYTGTAWARSQGIKRGTAWTDILGLKVWNGTAWIDPK
jgi:hypothetical protein